MNTKKTGKETNVWWNLGPGLGKAQKCGRVKPVNESPNDIKKKLFLLRWDFIKKGCSLKKVHIILVYENPIMNQFLNWWIVNVSKKKNST